jgi:hypothetical protein
MELSLLVANETGQSNDANIGVASGNYGVQAGTAIGVVFLPAGRVISTTDKTLIATGFTLGASVPAGKTACVVVKK